MNQENLQLTHSEIYSILAKDRIIFLAEDVTKQVAASLTSMLMYYDNKSDKEFITIYIHTDGGDSTALSGIYDTIQIINSPVRTICMGKAYSAGAFLLAAGTKGERYCFSNAEVMIHGIQCSFPAVPLSDQKDSAIYLKYLKSHNDKILKILSKHTGQPLEKITKDASRDMYLNSKEALSYGIIDKIIK